MASVKEQDEAINDMGEPEEEKNLKEKRNKIIKWISSILGLLVIMVLFWITSYYFVSNMVVKTAVQDMEELSQHDEQSIVTSLNSQWGTMKEIAQYMKSKHYSSGEDLAIGLNNVEKMLNCSRLTMVADDGYTVNSSLKLSYNDTLLGYCVSADGSFIKWVKNTESGVDGIGEILICGTKIEPFTVQGKKYTYIACRMDVDAFRNLLKIDCYDGRGYSSLIDEDGNYIVSIERDYTAQTVNNFFDELTEGELPQNYSLTYIRQLIENKQNFTLEYIGADGEKYLSVFSPFPDIPWCFVTIVQKKVFLEQGRSLTNLVSIFVTLMLTVILSVIIIMFRKRAKMYKLEVVQRKKIAEALAAEESAGRAKTKFFNSMSHDIRTPMNAIVGFTTLAATHIDDKERVADYLEKIGRASSHLLALVNDILDMSRIESGKMNLNEKQENLAEILRGIEDIIQADICSKQINLFIEMADVADEDIYCDKLKLNQILLNLLSNAIKFTAPGGNVSVRISEHTSTRENCATYEFSVKDTGIGMSKEFAEKIFEPFTREQTATVDGIQGTGLGMAITRNLVEMMGGTISVQSEEGKGTEFVVKIDFHLQSEHQKGKSDAAIHEPTTKQDDLSEESRRFEGNRLLLVDDVELNRVLAVTVLEMAGFETDCAKNGQEAVDKVADSAPGYYQAVLMDIQMPVMDGYEASRRIRALPDKALASIPIIAMTADAFEEDKQMALDAGMNAHVSKPIDVPFLLDTLRRMIDNN